MFGDLNKLEELAPPLSDGVGVPPRLVSATQVGGAGRGESGPPQKPSLPLLGHAQELDRDKFQSRDPVRKNVS